MSIPQANSLSNNSQPPLNDTVKSELVDGFANLLKTGKGSDLTITCHGTEFKVHKAILASRSKFFETACWGDFMEAQSSCINLPDDDAGLVKHMIDYFYLFDYGSDEDMGLYMVEMGPATNPATTELTFDDIEDVKIREKINYLWSLFPGLKVSQCLKAIHLSDEFSAAEILEVCFRGSGNRLIQVPKLAIHASMYGIADKYEIHGLKSLSVQKLKAALQDKGWVLYSHEGYTCSMMVEFVAAVQAAWELTPESDKGVRAPLLEYALENKDMLVEVERFKLAAIQQTPQFACDLLARSGKEAHQDKENVWSPGDDYYE